MILKLRPSFSQFNLELPDPDAFRSQLKTWRTVSSAFPPASTTSSSPPSPPANGPPPFVLQVVLDSSDLTSNQTVVLSDERGRRVRVEPPAAPSLLEQQNRYGHAIARPASAAGYARRPISPYPPPAASTGVGAVHGKHQSGTSSAGTRSPARGSNASTNATPPIVLEQWTLNLVPFSSAEPESRRRPGTSGEAPGFHPGSSEPSPVSSATASTSYSYASATAPPPPSAVELATVYKHSILHFRTLYSLVRTLPAFSLARTLARSRKGLSTAASGGGGSRVEGALAGSADMKGGGARPAVMTRHGAGLGVGVRLVQATNGGGSKRRPPGPEGLPPAPADEDEQDEVVAVDVALDGGDDATSAPRPTARAGAASSRQRPTSEKVVFPGVLTPFGYVAGEPLKFFFDPMTPSAVHTLTGLDIRTAPWYFRSSTASIPTLPLKTSRPSSRLGLSMRTFSAPPSHATRVRPPFLLPLAAARETRPRRTRWSGRARYPSRGRFSLAQQIDRSAGRLAAYVAKRTNQDFPRHQQHRAVPPTALCPRDARAEHRTSRRRTHLCVANQSCARRLPLCRCPRAHRVRRARSRRRNRRRRADTVQRAALGPAKLSVRQAARLRRRRSQERLPPAPVLARPSSRHSSRFLELAGRASAGPVPASSGPVRSAAVPAVRPVRVLPKSVLHPMLLDRTPADQA